VKIVDVEWTSYVNRLTIVCDCGMEFKHWARFTQAKCPRCGLVNAWHEWPWGNLPQATVELRS
jgi:hypothetical protein